MNMATIRKTLPTPESALFYAQQAEKLMREKNLGSLVTVAATTVILNMQLSSFDAIDEALTICQQLEDVEVD
jgi:hypothetical protein